MRIVADVRVGQIIHYYDKIGVAVVELSDNLNAGDTIRISGHGNEFTQVVDSMQIEHEKIDTAKKGISVGMKVIQTVREGDEVYKVV